MSYVAKREQPVWRQRLQHAYNRPEYDEALAALQSLQHELEDRNQSAAGSLAEGLDETLTLHRLGVYGLLGRSLKTTNGLESINALIEERCAKVDHWQHSRVGIRNFPRPSMRVAPVGTVIGLLVPPPRCDRPHEHGLIRQHALAVHRNHRHTLEGDDTRALGRGPAVSARPIKNRTATKLLIRASRLLDFQLDFSAASKRTPTTALPGKGRERGKHANGLRLVGASVFVVLPRTDTALG